MNAVHLISSRSFAHVHISVIMSEGATACLFWAEFNSCITKPF